MPDCTPQIVMRDGRQVLIPCPEETTSSDCPRVVQRDGQQVLVPCPTATAPEPTTPAEPTSSAEVHGTVVGSGLVDTTGDAGAQLLYSEVGLRFRHLSLSGEFDLVGPFLDSRLDGLEGQDPVRIRQAFFRYTIPNVKFTLGAQNTHFGYEPNNPAQYPFVTRSWLYSVGPVDTLEAGIEIGTESFQLLLGINGGNYQSYPFVNPYPAGYVGMHSAFGDFKLDLNVGFGPESADSRDMRVLFDVVGSYDPHPYVHVGVNYNEGFDANGGMDAHWRGLAGYLILSNNSWFQFFNRFEYLRDELGFMSGIPNHETFNYTGGVNFILPHGFSTAAEVGHQAGLNDDSPDATVFGARLAYTGTTGDL